jgi:hypothetical protein
MDVVVSFGIVMISGMMTLCLWELTALLKIKTEMNKWKHEQERALHNNEQLEGRSIFDDIERY